MKTLKHVGKLKNTGVKVLVVFRTLPGESNMALVLPTATLPDPYHDSLIQLVESDRAQETNELGEIMFIRRFPDGRPMLQAMQADNRLQRVATSSVTMTPTLNDSISLDELNLLIAEQKNCAVDDLAGFVLGARPNDNLNSIQEDNTVSENIEKIQEPDGTPLSDKDLARSYRSQADSLYKEAAKLRKQADELDPPQKKTTSKVKETADA
jgi:hypothetical protein